MQKMLSGVALGLALVVTPAAAYAHGAPTHAKAPATAPSKPVSAARPQAPAKGTKFQTHTYTFQTIDNPAAPTFNQLLGINDSGVVVGYDGSGAEAAQPSQGLMASSPYATFTPQVVPGAVQTRVTGIDKAGATVGFTLDAAGNATGFVDMAGTPVAVLDPAAASTPKVDELLGLSNRGVAVGFYNDAAGNSHAFKYLVDSKKFIDITPPGTPTSVVATGVNSKGHVSGYEVNGAVTSSFVRTRSGFTPLMFAGSSDTRALGINRMNTVVGSYVDAAGATHGFLATNALRHAKWQTIDVPNATSTVVNGINNLGQIVGFYTTADGATHGFLGTPS
jgi:probable HAF family extracellular repeat protein